MQKEFLLMVHRRGSNPRKKKNVKPQATIRLLSVMFLKIKVK